MRTSNATATWTGSLAEGNGEFSADSGAFAGEYSFGTRFGEEHGTNPEELIAAAHASCFSMALALALGEEGYDPEEISTDAECTMGEVGGAPTITGVRLSTRGRVPGIDEETFRSVAEAASEECPVSRAVAGNLEIHVEAELVG